MIVCIVAHPSSLKRIQPHFYRIQTAPSTIAQFYVNMASHPMGYPPPASIYGVCIDGRRTHIQIAIHNPLRARSLAICNTVMFFLQLPLVLTIPERFAHERDRSRNRMNKFNNELEEIKHC